VEGSRASDGIAMTEIASLQSGKGHRDENFPVASFLIHPDHRPAILAFYRFVRAADDIADNGEATPDEKLRLLDRMRSSLLGHDDVPEGVALLRELERRNLGTQHAEDLLEAFRRDVTKLRYDDWPDLMEYCRYSAMPVGRFVLDVHGEQRMLWPLSDQLCAALQVINHLQDCSKDFKELNRVYLPNDALRIAGIDVDALSQPSSGPQLHSVIVSLCDRVATLLAGSKPFGNAIEDARLGFEVTFIQELAEDLVRRLRARDPLTDRVHHNKPEAAGLAFVAAVKFGLGRLSLRRPAPLAVKEQ
jgi:hydroxysqualene synthase